MTRMVRSPAMPRVSNHEATGPGSPRTIEQRVDNEKAKAVIPGRAKREPGISRFPDAQLRI